MTNLEKMAGLDLSNEIEKLIYGYENLPFFIGKKAQEAACRFINENHDGFKALKALLDPSEVTVSDMVREIEALKAKVERYEREMIQAIAYPHIAKDILKQALEGGEE